MINKNQDVFDEMAAAWEGPVVPHSDIARFTNGMLRPKTMANADCAGAGPSGRFRLGNKVGYVKTDLAKWLRMRAQGPAVRADHNQHPTQGG